MRNIFVPQVEEYQLSICPSRGGAIVQLDQEAAFNSHETQKRRDAKIYALRVVFAKFSLVLNVQVSDARKAEK